MNIVLLNNSLHYITKISLPYNCQKFLQMNESREGVYLDSDYQQYQNILSSIVTEIRLLRLNSSKMNPVEFQLQSCFNPTQMNPTPTFYHHHHHSHHFFILLFDNLNVTNISLTKKVTCTWLAYNDLQQ